jgi:uncharacterized protein
MVGTAAFQDLRGYTLNSSHACRECALRYLCGGACRAWSRQPAETQTDLGAAPLDCAHLRRRTASLLESARTRLDIPVERWLAAGLPPLDA